MIIHQFDNQDPDCDKDIRLMFLIGDNEYKGSATSLSDYGKDKFYWSNNWKWLTAVCNNFLYKDNYERK